MTNENKQPVQPKKEYPYWLTDKERLTAKLSYYVPAATLDNVQDKIIELLKEAYDAKH